MAYKTPRDYDGPPPTIRPVTVKQRSNPPAPSIAQNRPVARAPTKDTREIYGNTELPRISNPTVSRVQNATIVGRSRSPDAEYQASHQRQLTEAQLQDQRQAALDSQFRQIKSSVAKAIHILEESQRSLQDEGVNEQIKSQIRERVYKYKKRDVLRLKEIDIETPDALTRQRRKLRARRDIVNVSWKEKCKLSIRLSTAEIIGKTVDMFKVLKGALEQYTDRVGTRELQACKDAYNGFLRMKKVAIKMEMIDWKASTYTETALRDMLTEDESRPLTPADLWSEDELQRVRAAKLCYTYCYGAWNRQYKRTIENKENVHDFRSFSINLAEITGRLDTKLNEHSAMGMMPAPDYTNLAPL